MSEDDPGFTPLTPIMSDENSLDAPRAALADAERVFRLVEDLASLGAAALADPGAALAAAKRLVAEKQAAVDAILDKMLNQPGTVQDSPTSG